jgi:hypothetical protein
LKLLHIDIEQTNGIRHESGMFWKRRTHLAGALFHHDLTAIVNSWQLSPTTYATCTDCCCLGWFITRKNGEIFLDTMYYNVKPNRKGIIYLSIDNPTILATELQFTSFVIVAL